MVFQAQQSFSPQLHLVPIYNALANWHSVWQNHQSSHLSSRRSELAFLESRLENLWQREGFARFAADYWMLASMLVQRLNVAGQKAFAGKHSKVADDARDALLSKYDETSMRQVNDLIAEFQKVML